MENKSDSKSTLRAWLYQLLAELEQAESVEATKSMSSGNHVILDIQFKG